MVGKSHVSEAEIITLEFYRRRRRDGSADYSPARLVQGLDHWAVVKFYSADQPAAFALFDEAMQIASAANFQGPERGARASVKTNYGGVLVLLGEVDKGEALLREALEEFRQVSARPHWEQAVTVAYLGIVAMSKGRLDEADGHLREGERLLRETLGDSNYYLAGLINQQAVLLSHRNDLKAAEAKSRAALDMMRSSVPGNRTPWATPAATLGVILLKEARAREAEEYLREALAINEEQRAKSYPTIIQLSIFLSQSLLAQGRRPEAVQLAADARDEAFRQLGEQSPLAKAAAANLLKISEK